MHIDLNADLAEGYDSDQALLQRVSSANVCCGVHAGNPVIMAQALQQAKQLNIRVGAHPSFPDREHFGRRAMDLPPQHLRAHILYQIGATDALCRAHGITMHYVKPHGALYNCAVSDESLATLIAQTVREYCPELKLMALSGSVLLRAAAQHGLETISEVFADRRYLPDGTLVPRQRADAVVDNPQEAVQQVLHMVQHQCVIAIDGSSVAVNPQSICLHGDGQHAVHFADTIRQGLEQHGIAIAA